MKKKLIIFITAVILIVSLVGCKAELNYDGNGSEKYLYNRYISKSHDYAENIYVPLIYSKEITSINIEDFDASSVQKPNITVDGLKYIDNYKDYHFHAIKLEITE